MKWSMPALVFVAVLTAIGGVSAPRPAEAGSEDAALALGAFAVFNQLMRGDTIFHDSFARRGPVAVHHPPTVVYAPGPPPPPPPSVVYPNGHWIAQRGHWVWVPNGYASPYPSYSHKHYSGYGHKHHKKYWRHHKKHHRHHDDDD
jgi:hypothetical protein